MDWKRDRLQSFENIKSFFFFSRAYARNADLHARSGSLSGQRSHIRMRHNDEARTMCHKNTINLM